MKFKILWEKYHKLVQKSTNLERLVPGGRGAFLKFKTIGLPINQSVTSGDDVC